MTTTVAAATMDDLFRVDSKAELVNGEIVTMSPTGAWPGYVADEIFVALHAYAKQTGRGRAVGDNKPFRASLPHRESFSPDAAYHVGRSTRMKYYEGAPIFAVEVRSDGDYGPIPEQNQQSPVGEWPFATCCQQSLKIPIRRLSIDSDHQLQGAFTTYHATDHSSHWHSRTASPR